jgi:hypothetical protein
MAAIDLRDSSTQETGYFGFEGCAKGDTLEFLDG